MQALLAATRIAVVILAMAGWHWRAATAGLLGFGYALVMALGFRRRVAHGCG